MRAIFLTLAFAVAASGPAAAGGYYYGYGYHHSCGNYNRLENDYRRLQRDYDRTRQQLVSQVQACQNQMVRQQNSYQNLINQQRGINADLIAQTGETSALMSSIAAENGVPEDLLDRPTREEYEDLQERYDRLLRAYRDLERDTRADAR